MKNKTEKNQYVDKNTQNQYEKTDEEIKESTSYRLDWCKNFKTRICKYLNIITR